MNDLDHLPAVREQYEEYPYPERNPLDEFKCLNTVLHDCLDRVNHYCFSGKKNFSLGTRVLVAGGGTGDSTIFLAEQLRDTDSEVVYLDFSRASMEIARNRADIRGLENITWINDSLLNIPALNLGGFDYIVCTGVLHHLEDPNEGLTALKSVLNDNGAMMIMVYALYGRTAVYQIQELMRLINENETDRWVKIKNCRMTLNALPAKHWYQWTNPNDKDLSDTELYDRFLHSQDRAYTVPQLYEFIENAGLKIVHLFPQMERKENDLNDPGSYIKDRNLLAMLQKLDLRRRQAIADLMHGRITQHSFYVARNVNQRPDPEMLEFIPSLPMQAPRESYDSLHRIVSAAGDYVTLNIPSLNTSLRFRKTPNAENFFKYLDGQRTMKDIYDAIILVGLRNNKQLSYDSLGQEFKDMFLVLDSYDLLMMRHQSVPAFKTSEELQARMRVRGGG